MLSLDTKLRAETKRNKINALKPHKRTIEVRWAILLVLFLSVEHLMAGEMKIEQNAATGWKVYTLSQGDTTIKVVPAAGANVQSIVHRGAEYFHQPSELKHLPGVGYGNPILYPTPNRIKAASFNFEGTQYEFPKGGDGNFIHGLVHSEAFQVDSTVIHPDFAEMVCSVRFEPNGRPFELFPWKHTFRMTIGVRDGSVRWEYEVDNDQSGRNLPFGVAFHPYIVYQNSRKESYLQVPAQSLMQADKQLPSGQLLQLQNHPLDARTPISLEGYRSDDVFFGMEPERPASIEFRNVKRSITFIASREFTHLVVWTPDRPYLGIENQTCSTDAHNLAFNGMNEVAHLQICPPGEKRTGHVEYVLK